MNKQAIERMVERLRRESEEGKIPSETYEDASALLLALSYILGETASAAGTLTVVPDPKVHVSSGATDSPSSDPVAVPIPLSEAIARARAEVDRAASAAPPPPERLGRFVQCKGGCGVSTRNPGGVCNVCSAEHGDDGDRASDPAG